MEKELSSVSAPSYDEVLGESFRIQQEELKKKQNICEYILERIREYIDEYSDTDVNGYHNSKWCAMKEAEAVVLEAMEMWR